MSAVIALTAEYMRQSRKSAAEAVAIEQRWTTTEKDIQELEFLVEKHSAEIRELTRLLYAIKSNPNLTIDNKTTDNIDDNNTNKSLIARAITEATDKLNLKPK